MNKFNLAAFIAFSAVLLAFSLSVTRITFHDTHEYITVAKEIAGIHNVNVHSGHSFVYPVYLSVFVKLFPSMQAIKFANVLWLIALAGLLAFGVKSAKPFLLFATSPLVWWLSPQITPVLPAAFFFTLAYLAVKRFEQGQQRIGWLAVCGLSLGLSFAVYDLPMLLLIGLLVLFFFYEKHFRDVIIMSIFIFLGTLPRFGIDYYFFHNPFYSIIRFIGSNISISHGIANKMPSIANLFNPWYVATILLVITPLLILSYTVDWKKHWRECLMLALLFLFFWWRAAPVDGLLQSAGRGVKYFLLFAPILFLVLSSKIKNKYIMVGAIVSILVVTAAITGNFIEHSKNEATGERGFNFFGETRDAAIAKDMLDISNDGYVKLISSGAGTFYAAQLFRQKPFIFWWKEYDSAANNRAAYSMIDYKARSKLNLLEQLELQATLNTKSNDFSGAKFLFEKNEKVSLGFSLEKCYRLLCVYNKVAI